MIMVIWKMDHSYKKVHKWLIVADNALFDD